MKKSQSQKRTSLRLDVKSNFVTTKVTPTPSSQYSRQTISTAKSMKTSTSSQQLTLAETPNPSFVSSEKEYKQSLNFYFIQDIDSQQKLIQQLINENKQLQFQNQAKDALLNKLMEDDRRAITSNTERSQKAVKRKVNTELGFTFCNSKQKQQPRILDNKLPKVFQIVPQKQKKFCI
ncbi:hypothetical protein pb186bvf_013605 [Paramecium bursaria]